MYTRRALRWRLIALFSWKMLLTTGAWASLAVWLHQYLAPWEINSSIPIAPIGTIGVAVAFYVGFKNSQAYDRSWEARKIWGGIVNVSRSWANQVLTFISDHHASDPVTEEVVQDVQKRLILRHLAWINILRFQLRRKQPWSFVPKGAGRRFEQPTDVAAMKKTCEEFLLPEEITSICPQSNAATQILRRQGEQLKHAIEKQQLMEEFRLIAMMDLITEMYTLQGKCERIKNTPFPRQYAYFSGVFVWIFLTLLPWGLVGEMANRDPKLVWLTVPISMLISWMFWTMEGVGDSTEDPFENFINDIPLTALCRTIEIDLLQMLGETDTKPPCQPVNDILM